MSHRTCPFSFNRIDFADVAHLFSSRHFTNIHFAHLTIWSEMPQYVYINHKSNIREVAIFSSHIEANVVTFPNLYVTLSILKTLNPTSKFNFLQFLLTKTIFLVGQNSIPPIALHLNSI